MEVQRRAWEKRQESGLKLTPFTSGQFYVWFTEQRIFWRYPILISFAHLTHSIASFGENHCQEGIILGTFILFSSHDCAVISFSLWSSAPRVLCHFPVSLFSLELWPFVSWLLWQLWTLMFISPTSARLCGLSPCIRNWQMHQIKVASKTVHSAP